MFTEESFEPFFDHTLIEYVLTTATNSLTTANESDWNYSSDNADSDATDVLSLEGEDYAQFMYSIDICLAFLSCLNLIVNIWLLMLSFGFVRNGCSSSIDTNERRPHYGLHLFIFNCAVSSVLLEAIGVLTNIGYLFIGENIFTYGIESEQTILIVRKTIDFLTYGLFNVTHLTFVLLLNVDKLLYILRPLHYHQMMNRRRVCAICIFTWCAALAMASPSLTYLTVQAQLRQEAILFAMCVVCPAGFDLISAIVVSTIVYRIQLGDSNTRRSVMGPRHSHFESGGNLNSNGNLNSRGKLKSTESSRIASTSSIRTLQRTYTQARTIKQRSRLSTCLYRHCNVFLRTFTPIIWTCITTLPYTSTMIYLYFGSDGEEDFVRRWSHPTTFKSLRAFGCLYITYFTGVPFIIVFNYFPYRRKLKIITRLISKRLHSLHRRVYAHRYQAVAKQDIVIGRTSTSCDGYVPHTTVTAL